MTTDTMTITVTVNLSTGEPTVDVSTAAVHPAPAKDIYPRVRARVCELVRDIPHRPGRTSGLAGLPTASDIGRGLSGKKQRSYLNTALDALTAEGVLSAVTDGKTTRYHLNVADTEGN